MKLIRCPRCELNYITEDQKLCEVCRKHSRGVREETVDLCIECGMRPAVPGEEVCRSCMREAFGRASVVAQVISAPEQPESEQAVDEDDEPIVDDAEPEDLVLDDEPVEDEPIEVPMMMDEEDDIDEDEEDLPMDERRQ